MADYPVDLLVRAGFLPVCEQNLCVRIGWCSDGVSGVVLLQWRAWKSKMDEVVFLPVLSGSSDFVGNSACYDLWRHQSDCLGPERMDLRVRLENGRRHYSQFIFLYSVGVQSFTILNIRIKDDRLEKPD